MGGRSLGSMERWIRGGGPVDGATAAARPNPSVLECSEEVRVGLSAGALGSLARQSHDDESTTRTNEAGRASELGAGCAAGRFASQHPRSGAGRSAQQARGAFPSCVPQAEAALAVDTVPAIARRAMERNQRWGRLLRIMML